MTNYIISSLDLSKNNAGPKARTDIDYFLKQLGFKNLCSFNCQSRFWRHIQKQRLIWHDIPQALKNLKGQDATVFFQYPIYSKILMKKILKTAKKNVSRFYVIIHDLESLRIFKDRIGFQKFEVNFFNQTDGLIVHNERMKRALKQMGVNVPMISLEIFDYQNAVPLTVHKNHQGIAFAGNLAKAPFLEKWNLNQLINLYGPHKQLQYPQNVYYRGVFPPDQLSAHLNESFGLIWDGNGLDKCNGMYGEYLKYNNPHKASLYLSSGMPIIVWNQSALSDLVQKYHVGIAVEKLQDLDQILPQLSDEDYCKMQKNAMQLANRLRKGYFIKSAVEKLLKSKNKK
ncbi:beta-1,6-galactofuranosyltransferase [Ligilactobacillus cholophilus]|uniref:beta-1,6-galactofuranosyltransferase n=1 Tax=Ligilactobacillus cholophilus TaxID=3050131 RepID=UPI0025B0EFD0|nr:beta-1,6-galactofuranosyltransferase [Ligilactobacillus cholophilus]